MQTAVRFGMLLAIAALGAAALNMGVACGQNITGYDTVDEPLLFLMREPAVHRELHLTEEQEDQLVKLNDQYDPTLLAARMWEPEKATKLNREVRAAILAAIEMFLTKEQVQRIDQIGRRAQGIRFVLNPGVRDALELTEEQAGKCRATVQEAAQKISELRQQVQQGDVERTTAEKLATEIRQTEQRQIFELLSETQAKELAMLVGPPFDVSQLGMVSFRAPDIASGGTWINSKPLTIKALKGKVVAVHFWTFGCSNCIQNYPWYRDWQTTLGKKGLVIVGVHTPETEGERDETSLRETIKREKFQFPVVVDDQRKIWDTWGNGMWPSVYLIDKQGRLRFWWYGELNWNGAGGQEIMAERIEQLLAEAA